MKQPIHLGLRISRTMLKVAMISLIVGTVLTVSIAKDIDGTGNYYELAPDQEITMIYGYATQGEPLQVAYSVERNDGYEQYGRQIQELIILGQLEYSETLTFDVVDTIKTMQTDGAFFSIQAKEGYYRLRLTNLNDVDVSVITGIADATMGQILSLVIAVLFIGLAGALFGMAWAVLWMTLLLAVVLFIIEQANKPTKVIYYQHPETKNQS